MHRPRRQARHVLATAVVAAVVAGCGSAGDPGAAEPTDTPRPTGTPGASPPLVDPAEPTELAAPDDDTWVPWIDAAEAADLTGDAVPGFRTAAGDVTCVFDAGDAGDAGASDPGATTVLCERAAGLGVDAPRPVDCDGGWGDTVAATAPGGGELVCADDAVTRALRAGPDTVLADGGAVTLAGLTCAARAGAVQCLDDAARGLVISARVIVVR